MWNKTKNKMLLSLILRKRIVHFVNEENSLSQHDRMGAAPVFVFHLLFWLVQMNTSHIHYTFHLYVLVYKDLRDARIENLGNCLPDSNGISIIVIINTLSNKIIIILYFNRC